MRRTVRLALLLAVLALGVGLLAACGAGLHAPRGYSTPLGTQAHSPTFGLPPAGYVPPPTSPLLAAVPTEEMFDTVTLSTVPPHPRAVAGYLPPSSWPTYGSLAGDFPSAIRVPIAVQAYVVIRGVRMGCLDVEPGDAIPSQVPGWIRAEIRVHVIPCVYSNLSTWATIRYYLARASIPRTAYLAWLAYWTYHPGLLIAGYDARQWTQVALARNLDESTVTQRFLGLVAPAPKPKPAPPRLVCFGHGATRGAKGCQPVLKLYARRTGAATASTRALGLTQTDLRAQRCVRPYRRAACRHDGRLDRILTQRARWFTTEAASLRKAYS